MRLILRTAAALSARVWCVRWQLVAHLASCVAVFCALPFAATAQNPKTIANAMGSLSGFILADSGEAPIAQAEVWFPGLKRMARSDERGRYSIAELPVGSHAFLVRRIGFEPLAATITVRSSEKGEADFFLSPAVVKLDRVVVTATVRSKRLAEFEMRREFGMGFFVTADYFERNSARPLLDLLARKLPGVRSVGGGRSQVLVTTRASTRCPLKIVLNGIAVDAGFDINSIESMTVLGVEYYTPSNTPAQYGGLGANCGTVVLWTQ